MSFVKIVEALGGDIVESMHIDAVVPKRDELTRTLSVRVALAI